MQMLCSPLECGSTRNSFLNVKSGVLPSGCGCRVVKLNNMTSDEENKCTYLHMHVLIPEQIPTATPFHVESSSNRRRVH